MLTSTPMGNSTINLNLQPKLCVFGQWEEIRVAWQNKLHTDKLWSAGRFEPRTFSLSSDSANTWIWLNSFKASAG